MDYINHMSLCANSVQLKNAFEDCTIKRMVYFERN